MDYSYVGEVITEYLLAPKCTNKSYDCPIHSQSDINQECKLKASLTGMYKSVTVQKGMSGGGQMVGREREEVWARGERCRLVRVQEMRLCIDKHGGGVVVED